MRRTINHKAEEIVKFDTAKLAYTKGYDNEIGLGYRHGDYYVLSNGKLNGHVFKPAEEIKRLATEGKISVSDKLEPLISAPALNYLQEWLRKEFKIHVVVMPNLKEKRRDIDNFPVYEENGYRWSIWSLGKHAGDSQESSDMEVYETYEVAQECALTVGLSYLPSIKEL